MAEETGTQEEKPPTLLKLGDLKNLIGDVVDRAFASREESKGTDAGPGGAAPRARRTPTRDTKDERTMQQEVDAAVERLQAEKERRAAEAALRQDVDDLKTERKSREEKPPVERRRVHRFMGWGE